MNDSIIQDKASGAFYCGSIKNVPQWRPEQSEAVALNFLAAFRVARRLMDRDEQDGVPVLDLRVIRR